MSAHTDLLARLRDLAEESRRQWRTLVDDEDSGPDPVAAAQSCESAIAAWDRAIDAVESGDLQAAEDALAFAERLGDEMGAGSCEFDAWHMVREAIEAARSARKEANP